MIFVTVGTHEQQFNRLVEYMDEWAKRKKLLDDEIIIQTGFSTYIPKHCSWSKLFPYQDMVKLVNDARIVITHGGPSSFIMPLQVGKIPVVVPRQKQFGEHINDHQVEFSRAVVERCSNIIVVEEIEKLEDVLMNYESIVAQLSTELVSNNTRFCIDLEKIVDEMFSK